MKTLFIVLFFIILLIVILLYKSKFKNIGNILVIASHIKQKYGNQIINNNLKMICDNNDKINLIIIVYSNDKDTLVDTSMKTYKGIQIVYIEDQENKFYDFYKYKLAYSYIKQNNLEFNWVLVTNDSIIITEDVSWIVDEITRSNKCTYIGILGSNGRIFEKNNIKKHYQSWWLNFKPGAFEYWNNHINFNDSHSIKDYDHFNDSTIGVKNIINDFEVDLSNEMINKFDNKVIFDVNGYEGSLFWNDQLYYDYYNNKNFKFIKMKKIRKELLPSNLKALF